MQPNTYDKEHIVWLCLFIYFILQARSDYQLSDLIRCINTTCLTVCQSSDAATGSKTTNIDLTKTINIIGNNTPLIQNIDDEASNQEEIDKLNEIVRSRKEDLEVSLARLRIVKLDLIEKNNIMAKDKEMAISNIIIHNAEYEEVLASMDQMDQVDQADQPEKVVLNESTKSSSSKLEADDGKSDND